MKVWRGFQGGGRGGGPAGSRSRNQSLSRSVPEPELLEKKIPGAGAAKKLADSSALREDKKHKEIVL